MHEVGTDQYVPVGEFYAGKSVFITGGTGFLGKVLVEKLLRSCSGIKTIYLLIRPKKGRNPQDRLAYITKSALFEKLKNENSSAMMKLVPITGDVAQPNLGISTSDWSVLVETVSVVFHCAATVNFEEPLRKAVNMNVLGTKRVLELCHQITQLKALVHVSTCYSNCDLQNVKEAIYPSKFDPEHVASIVDNTDDDTLAYLSPKLLGKLPNTYTFTKSLAENIVQKECGNLPITIVRPSIVTSSWKEPMPGWIETLNGPTGVIAAVSRGIMHHLVCEFDKTTDLVPVDVSTNVIICAAWHMANMRTTNLRVYNCCSGCQNPLTWGVFRRSLMEKAGEYPSIDGLWFPSCRGYTNVNLYKIMVLLTQVLPSYILDFCLNLTGGKPMLVNIQTKLLKALQAIIFFSTGEWYFDDRNVQQLRTCLQGDDRHVFDFDIRNLNWKEYLGDYLYGIRTYVVKEDPKTLPQAKIRFRRLHWLYTSCQIALTTFVGYLIMSILRMCPLLQENIVSA